jgi:hypothetical protein
LCCKFHKAILDSLLVQQRPQFYRYTALVIKFILNYRKTYDYPKENEMASLGEDLENYAHEAYTKKDVKAGLKLLAELAGWASLAATAGALSTIVIPYIGPTWSRQLIMGLTNKAMEEYGRLSAEDRKYVRAAVRFIRPETLVSGAVGNIADMEFFADLADKAGKIEETGDKIREWWIRLKK